MLQTLQTLKVVGYRYSKNILSITILTTCGEVQCDPVLKNSTCPLKQSVWSVSVKINFSDFYFFLIANRNHIYLRLEKNENLKILIFPLNI